MVSKETQIYNRIESNIQISWPKQACWTKDELYCKNILQFECNKLHVKMHLSFAFPLKCLQEPCNPEFRKKKHFSKAFSTDVLSYVEFIAFKLRNLPRCRSHNVLSAQNVQKLWQMEWSRHCASNFSKPEQTLKWRTHAICRARLVRMNEERCRNTGWRQPGWKLWSFLRMRTAGKFWKALVFSKID